MAFFVVEAIGVLGVLGVEEIVGNLCWRVAGCLVGRVSGCSAGSASVAAESFDIEDQDKDWKMWIQNLEWY